MQLKNLLLGGLMASSVIGSQITRRNCGTDGSRNEPRNDAILGSRETAHNHKKRAILQAKVYVHVVSTDPTPAGGNVPQSQILNQIQVLNKAYAPAGIRFTLVSTTRTINRAWSDKGNEAAMTAMKTALRKGSAADLNLYILHGISKNGDSLLGTHTFPWDYRSNPRRDGVCVIYNSLPGNTGPFGLGHTAVHEVGHWFGLYHTFQGGCTPPGDYVDDTPYEASPAYGCPEGRNTCPAPGVDPIHNYMNYVDDACMRHFTPGQATRMRQQVATYRGMSS